MDFLQITNYARGLFARAAQSGWRPFWGWLGGYISLKLVWFAAIDVPERGLNVPDGFYVFVLGFVSLYVTTFIVRAAEKQMDRRAPGGASPNISPTGGYVNNEALRA